MKRRRESTDQPDIPGLVPAAPKKQPMPILWHRNYKELEPYERERGLEPYSPRLCAARILNECKDAEANWRWATFSDLCGVTMMKVDAVSHMVMLLKRWFVIIETPLYFVEPGCSRHIHPGYANGKYHGFESGFRFMPREARPKITTTRAVVVDAWIATYKGLAYEDRKPSEAKAGLRRAIYREVFNIGAP